MLLPAWLKIGWKKNGTETDVNKKGNGQPDTHRMDAFNGSIGDGGAVVSNVHRFGRQNGNGTKSECEFG